MSNIFVFGSNLAGRHGRGAALCARKEHGAVYGVGRGLTGQSYAIPTKGYKLEVLELHIIELYVKEFIEFAESNPDLDFMVTKIGCGLAGYSEDQISPMFLKAPSNCELPLGWRWYE